MARRWKPGRKQREKILRATRRRRFQVLDAKRILRELYAAQVAEDKPRARAIMEFMVLYAPFANMTRLSTVRSRRSL